MHDVPHGQRISCAVAAAGPLHVLRLRAGARQRANAAMDPAATPRRVIALDVLATDAVRSWAGPMLKPDSHGKPSQLQPAGPSKSVNISQSGG